MLSLEMIYKAANLIRNVARRTPIIEAPLLGNNVFMKLENLQLTGAFKLRGAYYKIATLSEEEKQRGVIACSAGNHAQGVALSAAKMGIPSVICIPEGAPLSKIEATRKYGGEVVLVPGVYDDAYNEALSLQKAHGYTLIHPFEDDKIIAGQGTIGLEILEKLPHVETVVVPIGGGGLISGIAYAIKALKPSCRVIGVQAEGAAGMYVSRLNNQVTELSQVSTIADGIAVKKPGELTYSLCSQYVDEIVTVTEEEIASAILTLMENHKSVVEGAGAASVAAVMFGKVDLQDKPTVCVVSGGNIDVKMLSNIITNGLAKTGRLYEFTVELLDKPGQLVSLSQIIRDQSANIISVIHEREMAALGACVIKMVVETRDTNHCNEINQTLIDHGYKPFSRYEGKF